MRNPIPSSYVGMKSRVQQAANGLAKHASELKLVHINAESVTESIKAFDTADTNYKRGKTELATSRATLEKLVEEVRAFNFTARDVLKPHLGRTYSAAWDEAGFYRSLGVPRLRSLDRLVQLQSDLKNYFKSHPTHENAELKVTAVRAEALHKQLSAAVNAVDKQRAANSKLLDVRLAKTADLRQILQRLLKELSLTLSPTDARWLAFGFNLPGAPETPEAPAKVKVIASSPPLLSLAWRHSPRAKYYRVRMKVKGVDQEPILIGNPSEPDFIIENAPSNAEVEIAVAAVNDAGESPWSESLVVRTSESTGDTVLTTDRRDLVKVAIEQRNQ